MTREGIWRGRPAPGKTPVLLVLSLLFVASLGAALILFSATRGVGVGYDSIFYLTSATNLLQGRGLQWTGGGGELRPLVHYPPLYPIVLAGIEALGFEQVAAATWASAVLFGANIALTGALVYVSTRRLGAALAGSFFALLSPVLLDVHLEAMSEPLFLFWLLTSLSALLGYLRTSSRWLLLLAGAAAGLSYVTRYVGVAMVVLGILAVAFRRHPIRTRTVDLALFAVPGLLPTLVWYARNILLTGSASNRVLGYHPVTLVALRGGLDTVTRWILPTAIDLKVRAALSLVMALILFVLAVLHRRGRSKAIADGRESLSSVLASFKTESLLVLFALIYAVLLVFSLTFLDASTRLNDRILSPVYLVLLVAAFSSWPKLSPSVRPVVALAGLFLIALNIARSWGLVEEMRVDGRGFNSREWQRSGTLRLLNTLPADTLLYTNEAFPVQFLTGRPAYGVPEAVDSVKGLPRPDYVGQMTMMRERLQRPNSALVIFLGDHYRVELPPLGELVNGLKRVATAEDGEIYVDRANAEGMPW